MAATADAELLGLWLRVVVFDEAVLRASGRGRRGRCPSSPAVRPGDRRPGARAARASGSATMPGQVLGPALVVQPEHELRAELLLLGDEQHGLQPGRRRPARQSRRHGPHGGAGQRVIRRQSLEGVNVDSVIMGLSILCTNRLASPHSARCWCSLGSALAAGPADCVTGRASGQRPPLRADDELSGSGLARPLGTRAGGGARRGAGCHQAGRRARPSPTSAPVRDT